MLVYRKLASIVILLSAVALLSACSGYQVVSQHPNDPDYAPVAPSTPHTVPNLSGSLYQSDYGLDSLFVDVKAYRIGDILTVTLAEATTANKAANTSTTKTGSVDVQNPTLFGSTPQFNVPGIIPLASNINNNLRFATNSNNSFAGNGTSAQKNSLQGSITVTVMNVLSNGNLMIRGEKWITLNQGSEFIRLSGIVRPYDIDPNNTVPSTKIANPRIIYSETGALAEANQTGWLARFFNGPLFPY